MNLVKLQDDLKMLPMAALQSKAQGQDPQVPPWLATAVLNERMDAQKKAGMAQGAATGEQPSVVEQLNQKAGLMTLQGQQQQQAQQQMMQQMAQAPQPAPEGVPQPESQPEPQMMAQGGLAGLSVNPRMFEYKHGGIIGFAGPSGSDVPPVNPSKDRLPGESFADFRRRMFQLELQTEQAKNAAEDVAREAERQRRLAARGEANNIPPSPFFERQPLVLGTGKPTYNQIKPISTQPGGEPVGRGGLAAIAPKPIPSPQPSGDEQIPMSPELRAAMEKDAAEQGIANPQFNFRGPKGSTATLTPQLAQPSAQPPAQPPAQAPVGIAALPPAKEYDPIAMAKAAQAAFPMARKEPSVDEQLATQKRFREASGAMPAGEPQRQEIEAYKAETERLRKAREEADAMETLSGYGGLAGLGQRRAAIMQRNILADTIRNDATEKMRVAMEGMKQAEAAGNQKEYNEQKEKYITAQDARANAGVLAANELAKVGMQTKTTERGQDIQAATAAAQDVTTRRGQDLILQAAKLTAASADARATRDEKRQLLQELNVLGKQLEASIKEIDPRMALPEDKQKRAKYQQSLENVQRKIAEMGGVALVPAESTMTPPPGAVREVKK